MGTSKVLSEGDFFNGMRVGPWPKGMTPGLPVKTVTDDSLVDALNVDVDDSGRIRTRLGFQKIADSDNCRSAFRFGDIVYFLSGENLVRLNGESLVVVRGGYQLDDNIHVAVGGGNTWMYSTTYGMERIVSMDVFAKSEPDSPVSVSLSEIAGSLYGGKYAVAVSYLDQYGIESAPSSVYYITVANGLSVSFPLPSDPNVTKARVYCSTADGSVLYKHSDIVLPVTNCQITSSVGAGKMLKQENWYRMPDVSGIAHTMGRLVGYSGKDVFFAEPFMGSLMSETGGVWASFEEEITMCIAVEKGLYVGAKKTFFLTIDQDGLPSATEVLGFNSVKGTGVYDEYDMGVYWWADDGLFFGDKNGQVKLVSSQYLAPDVYDKGASIVMYEDGIQRVVTSFNNDGQTNGLRCYDFSDIILVGNKTL